MSYHHTVVIKEWPDVARDLLCRNILSWRHIIGIRGKHVIVSNVSKAKEWMATNNVTSCTKCSLPPEYCKANLISTLVICLKFVFIESWINLLHTLCVGTRRCIRSCLLCEQIASQLVAYATCSDTGSHNRLDLIQSLLPPHYVHCM